MLELLFLVTLPEKKINKVIKKLYVPQNSTNKYVKSLHKVYH